LLAAGWPRTEREVFELYFVEGFDEDEIALIEKMSRAEVRSEIEKVQDRMRESFREVAYKAAPAISEALSR
jgi:DNA-directed RNA polymerase specialized sigma24 family protein